MKRGMKYWYGGLVVIGLVIALLGPRMASADTINPGVLDINATLGGKTYGQWSENWWQYAFSVTTFDNCPAEPSGQMWFLVGTTGGTATRSCTVPAGKNIMFPIFNTEQSVVEADAAKQQTGGQTTCTVGTTPIPDSAGKPIKGTGYGPLLRCVQAIAQFARDPGATLEADIDGTTIVSPTHYQAASPPPPFPFTTVEGNPFGLCPGLGPCPLTSKAVADGYWIILQNPLPAGTHTIHFAATVPFPNFTFTTDVTYNLTVG